MATVKELVEKLSTFNPDLPIALLHNAGTTQQGLSNLQEVSAAKFNDENGKPFVCVVVVDETTRARTAPAPMPESQPQESPEQN